MKSFKKKCTLTENLQKVVKVHRLTGFCIEYAQLLSVRHTVIKDKTKYYAFLTVLPTELRLFVMFISLLHNYWA